MLGVSAVGAFVSGSYSQAHGATPEEGDPATGEVILHAYAPDGTFLDFAAFRDRQTNGAGEKWYDDALLEAKTLMAVKVRLLEEVEGATAKFALPLEGGPYTLTLSWPTSHGYSALMADLPGPGVYDLNELAARTLHDRQADREFGPEPSEAIIAARQATEEALAKCEVLGFGPEKGALAARCLELASEAQLMLDLALPATTREDVLIGVTFTKVPTPEQINSLTAITGGKRTPIVRLVIGDVKEVPAWADAIEGIHAIGGKALIQVCSGRQARAMGHDRYMQRIDVLLKGLSAAEFWELGNDLGGDWLSDDQSEKFFALTSLTYGAKKIFSEVSNRPGDDPGKNPPPRTMMSIRYQLGQSDEAHSMFTWMRKNLNNGRVFYRAFIGYVSISGLSINPRRNPLGTAAYRVMTTFQEKEPHKESAISSLIYATEGPEAGPWWFGSSDDPVKARRIVAEHLTSVGLAGQKRSWAAPFWWNYLEDEAGADGGGPVSHVLAKVAAQGG